MPEPEAPIYHGAVMRELLRRRYRGPKRVALTQVDDNPEERDEKMPEREEAPENVIAMGHTKVTERVTETDWAIYAGRGNALPVEGAFSEIQEAIQGERPKQIEPSKFRRLYNRLRLHRTQESEQLQLPPGS